MKYLSYLVEPVSARGLRMRLYCLAPFGFGPLKHWGIAIVRNIPASAGKEKGQK